MRSTRRILSLVAPKRLTLIPVSFPVRTFHRSVPRFMPARGTDGSHDEKLLATEHMGFENSKGKIRSLKKIIGEIPITTWSVEVHRDLKHSPLYFSYNQNFGYSDLSFLYQNNFATSYVSPSSITANSYDIDKIRLKDLPNSKILLGLCDEYKYSGSAYKKAIPVSAYMTFSFAALSISLFFFGILVRIGQGKYDQYLHGETDEQYKTRKSIEKICNKLEKSDPKYYDATALTPREEKELQKCKQGCKSLKLFHESMRLEMTAKRNSGHGDPRLFGTKQLSGVYDDTLRIAPLIQADRDLADSILSRVESEKAVIKLKREEEERASKEMKYHDIKNSGLRK